MKKVKKIIKTLIMSLMITTNTLMCKKSKNEDRKEAIGNIIVVGTLIVISGIGIKGKQIEDGEADYSEEFMDMIDDKNREDGEEIMLLGNTNRGTGEQEEQENIYGYEYERKHDSENEDDDSHTDEFNNQNSVEGEHERREKKNRIDIDINTPINDNNISRNLDFLPLNKDTYGFGRDGIHEGTKTLIDYEGFNKKGVQCIGQGFNNKMFKFRSNIESKSNGSFTIEMFDIYIGIKSQKKFTEDQVSVQTGTRWRIKNHVEVDAKGLKRNQESPLKNKKIEQLHKEEPYKSPGKFYLNYINRHNKEKFSKKVIERMKEVICNTMNIEYTNSMKSKSIYEIACIVDDKGFNYYGVHLGTKQKRGTGYRFDEKGLFRYGGSVSKVPQVIEGERLEIRKTYTKQWEKYQRELKS